MHKLPDVYIFVTADHVSAAHRRVNELYRCSQDRFDGRWFASGMGGCSKGADTPVNATMGLLFDHACQLAALHVMPAGAFELLFAGIAAAVDAIRDAAFAEIPALCDAIDAHLQAGDCRMFIAAGLPAIADAAACAAAERMTADMEREAHEDGGSIRSVNGAAFQVHEDAYCVSVHLYHTPQNPYCTREHFVIIAARAIANEARAAR
jgi:glutathione S-transferase